MNQVDINNNKDSLNHNNIYNNNGERASQFYKQEPDLYNLSNHQNVNEEEQEYDNEFIQSDRNDNNEENSSINSQGKSPIYEMSLQLEDGKIAKIKIYSDSNPVELSQAFCQKHNLDSQAEELIASQIEALI